MGRKKIEIKHIDNDRNRRKAFKKRRKGLLNKAIQLSKLTGAKILLKVYNERDQSLIEYCSSWQYESDFNYNSLQRRAKHYLKVYDEDINEGEGIDSISQLEEDVNDE